jgi:hypothetical protein
VKISDSPTISLSEIQLRLKLSALLLGQLQIKGLILRDGKFLWPISPTNALALENIQADLRFETNDTWSLDNFHADFAGAKLALSGDVAHAPEIRDWKIFRGKKSGNRAQLQKQLQKFSDALDKIHFQGAPQLSLNVNGDARDIRSFVSRLNLEVPAAQTPWGDARNIQFAATVSGISTNLNAPGNWWDNARESLRFNGELAFTNGSTATGAAIGSARAHFSYSNFVWELPDLAMTESKTRLELNGEENDATKKFGCHVRGALAPETLRPFLTASNAIRGLNRFTFTAPLILDVNATGNWNDFASIGANGSLALTNFTIRAQSMDNVAGEFFYTNRVLEFFHPQLARANGAQKMSADEIALNFNERLIYFTNGLSTAEPLVIARAIGPKLAHLLEPYHFLSPPLAYVNGHAPLHDVNSVHDVDDADMRFDIPSGAPFQWLKLKSPDIVGTIHWLGETLILTNVTASFYGGNGNGFANFDFRPAHPGADYNFMMDVRNVNLHTLMMDLASPTNHLEGTLAGQLVVTSADTRNLQSWNGHGRANLHDGLLWDTPIFGILSPVLNTILPGLGNSRATDAAAKFTITNGVIFTDSLEIRSLMARLNYSGTVDFKNNVNARVTAQLLRDTWAVGPLISAATWPVSKLFEYKITGTLKNPKPTPVLFPTRLLMMPLHPIRSLEEIFPGDNFDNFTNAPSGK